MISQERFEEIESEHGCGYYHVCWEKACACAIVTENKGLTKEIYEGFEEENRKMADEYENLKILSCGCFEDLGCNCHDDDWSWLDEEEDVEESESSE